MRYRGFSSSFVNSLGKQNYEKLIDFLDHFYVVTCQYPFGKKADRIKLDVGLAQSAIKQMEHPTARQEDANRFFEESELSTGGAADWPVTMR